MKKFNGVVKRIMVISVFWCLLAAWQGYTKVEPGAPADLLARFIEAIIFEKAYGLLETIIKSIFKGPGH
jgi:hypothetical protein